MPDRIEPAIGRYGKRAEPVPLTGIDRVVVYTHRCAEGEPSICAAHKHHVGCASSGRHNAGQHVNVVVRRSAGFIDRQEYHSIQSRGIDSPATEEATQVDGSFLVKGGRDTSVLGVARANTPKRARSFATDKEVAISIDVECPVDRRVRNNNRVLPSDAAVGGTLKFHTTAATVDAVVCLVLEPVAGTVGLIDRKPFLVAAACQSI